MTIAFAFLVGASPFNETFDRATEAYKAGEDATAIQLYEQLVSELVFHPAVFYNLGNAYYRAGLLGAAIANYERALQVDPGLEGAARNLTRCVNQTGRRLARPLPPEWEQSLLFWHYNLAPSVTRAIALIFWVGFWVLLAVWQWRPMRYLGAAALALGMLAVVFGASAWIKAHPAMLAVASEQRVPVRYGTAADATIHFELYEGDRVSVDRRENGWARVATADGKRGWALEKSLTFVGPPYERPHRLGAAWSDEEARM